MVSCEIFGLPNNSRYIFNEGNMYNQTVVVGCLTGYIPTNVVALTCGLDGHWDTDLPMCTEGRQ